MEANRNRGAEGIRPSAPAAARSQAGDRAHRRLTRAGTLVLGAGVLLVSIPAALLAYGNWQESQLTQQWRGIVASVPEPVDSVPPVVAPPTAAPVAAVPVAAAAPSPITARTSVPIAFAMRVPRLGYYAAVVEGVGLNQLATGPGHYSNTPYPGQPGVVGIAAHNSYWLGFGDIHAGDRIVLETRTGTFTYQVTGTKIVLPSDTTVFAQKPGYRLTLTTCWPLWAGALADHRLAIFADEVGGVA